MTVAQKLSGQLSVNKCFGVTLGGHLDLLKLCEFYITCSHLECHALDPPLYCHTCGTYPSKCIQYYCKQHKLFAHNMEMSAVPVGAGATLSLQHSALISVTIPEELLTWKGYS